MMYLDKPCGFTSCVLVPPMGGIGKRLKNMTCPSFRVELAKRRRSHSQVVDDPISITVCVHALKDGGIIDGQDIHPIYRPSSTDPTQPGMMDKKPKSLATERKSSQDQEMLSSCLVIFDGCTIWLTPKQDAIASEPSAHLSIARRPIH